MTKFEPGMVKRVSDPDDRSQQLGEGYHPLHIHWMSMRRGLLKSSKHGACFQFNNNAVTVRKRYAGGDIGGLSLVVLQTAIETETFTHIRTLPRPGTSGSL